MALERRGDKSYFRRSIRARGRVTSQYLGSGKSAEMWADVHEFLRRERWAKQEHARMGALLLDDLDSALARATETAMIEAREALAALGWHHHARGRWRRRRARKA
jgi:hypothetical protein